MAVETLDDVFGAAPAVPVEFQTFVPDAPPMVGVGWVADTYGLTSRAVYAAIHEGRLPAIEVPGSNGARTHIIRPEHAFALWGSRLVKRAMNPSTSRRTAKTVTV